jgi:hypothetical protein
MNISSRFQYSGDIRIHLRHVNADILEAGFIPVAYPGQHIGNRIRHSHAYSPYTMVTNLI